MGNIYVFSCSVKFKERLEKLVGKGRRSEFIVKAVNKELDELEKEVTAELMRDEWLKENVVPIFRTKFESRSFMSLLDFAELPPDKTRSQIQPLLIEAGLPEISEEHRDRAMWLYVRERKQQDR